MVIVPPEIDVLLRACPRPTRGDTRQASSVDERRDSSTKGLVVHVVLVRNSGAPFRPHTPLVNEFWENATECRTTL
jgi:hypothetical protein